MSALATGTNTNNDTQMQAIMLRNVRVIFIAVVLPKQSYKLLSKYIVLRHQIVEIIERRGDKPRHATARDNRKTHTPDNGYNRTNIHQNTSQIKKVMTHRMTCHDSIYHNHVAYPGIEPGTHIL
ncbi:MAG: hypothetical protein [Bacteriophage sp.]|nr:MAG: hypothetical protein [Bacteriophage sp.]